jgi:hypothetical protein
MKVIIEVDIKFSDLSKKKCDTNLKRIGKGFITTGDMMLLVYTGVRAIVNLRVLSYNLLCGFI